MSLVPPKTPSHLLKLDELFSLLLGATQFVNHLEGGVLVEPPETVAKVEHVHAGLALEVIDVKGKLCSCIFKAGQSSN